MSSLWLLEAKPFAVDDRSVEARSVKYWFGPGMLVVGRQGADIVVEEDKSISRKHAELTVPPMHEQASEGHPYIMLKDQSKYGTWLSPDGNFAEGERLAADPVKVHDKCMVRFGFKSPFRLYLQDWTLHLSPAQRKAAEPAALAAILEAAAAAGLPVLDVLPDHPGTRVLALGATPLQVDGPTLLALLRGYPIISVNWLLAWQRQKVWRNSHPEVSSFAVQLQYRTAAGSLKSLGSSAALLQCAEQQPLGGRSLLWLASAREPSLQQAAALLGASNSDAPASGRAATAAAKAARAVVVKGGQQDAVPPAYRKLAWTTPALLIAGVLEGDPDAAIQSPAAASPSTASKAQPQGDTPVSATAGKRRGKAAAVGAAEEDAGGSETDVSSDSGMRQTQRVLVPDEVAPPVPAALGRQQQGPPDQQQQQSTSSAAVHGAATRKRRQSDVEDVPSCEEHPPRQHREPAAGTKDHAAQPAAAKRRRTEKAALAQAAAAHGEAAHQAVNSPLPLEGWRTMKRAAGAASARARSPESERPGAASAAPASQDKPGTARRRGRKLNMVMPGASEHTAPTAIAEQRADAARPDETAGDGDNSHVAYMALVVAPVGGKARAVGNAGETNFKAFRRGSGALPATTRPFINFDEQPWTDEGPVDAEAFMKAEAERQRRRREADDLFAANVRAKKAAPLPDPEGDTPPKGAARGRGSKKAAAGGRAQQTMLNFLPTQGAGRGRGGRARKA